MADCACTGRMRCPMDTRRVIVVGAGVAGLGCAAELAARGEDVLLLEAAGAPGGKMRQVQVAGAEMDAGPTVFTMRWVFDELFQALGARLEDHLPLQPLEVLARHAWSCTERLDLYADVARSADAIGVFAGAAAVRGYLDFCRRAADIYRTLETPFLRGARPTPWSLVMRAGWRGLPGLLRISPWSTLWDELKHHFHDPRLRQLFGRYATYCGSSPMHAPATLMLVAHVEQQGVWLVEGGMHRVAQTLARLAQQHGAVLRLNAPVIRILLRNGRACGVRLADGEVLAADAVVFNGDVAALGRGLLGDSVRHAAPPVAPSRRSLSALTWNLLAPASGFPLARHTVFFSDDYPREFADIGAGRLPAAPTVYVCAQDRDGGGRTTSGTPAGAERLLLIVNAPATGDTDPPCAEELERCETQTFRLLAHCGLAVSRQPDHAQRTTPQDFERLFPATGGALYGRASHGWAASFSRPGSRSAVPGLYLAGGSTHPGPGVPMAALSGRRAAASLLEDRSTSAGRPRPRRADPPSTARCPPVATSGGTSTR
jgi:1-hydroxycarotenoid 3,4-desaturase